MLKRLIFISVLTIVLLGWSLPVMADESAADNQKAELTTSFKGGVSPVNITGSRDTKSQDPIIWDNGPPTSSLNYYSSQLDPAYPFVSQVADDFILDGNMNVTDVHWWGGFWNGTAFDPCNFYIYFYADDGTGNMPTGAGMPDPSPTALASYYFQGVSGLPLDPNGHYEYDVDLSPPFPAAAGVKYWIAIQADFAYPPQWGSTNTSGIQLHSAVQGFPLLAVPFWTDLDPAVDMAFYLTGVGGEDSLYWKPSYEDYAPNGMPDIDQKQDQWGKYETGAFTFCGPVAVANCFKWFDSKYNVPPGFPGDMMDQFPLVRQYIDALGGMAGPYDDHDPWNMDHPATPWMFGATPPPPPTMPQPFVPGPQPPMMPPWGELVERLAWYFNTDGVQSGYCEFSGTKVSDMQAGIDEWFESEMFEDGSTIADTLYERTWQRPTFAWVETLVEKCQDVILLLGFWFEDPPGSGAWFRCGGHYVTVAGINSEEFLIAFSDPYFDNAELGGRGRVGDGWIIPHPHGYHDVTLHNDEGNVSHDIYGVSIEPISPGGLWELIDYPISLEPSWCFEFHDQNVPPEFEPVTMPWNQQSPVFTEVEYAIEISPWEYPPDCGDCNGSGTVNIADVVCMVNYLFIPGSPPPVSMVKSDVNHDGSVDIADVVYMLNYLFLNGSLPQCYDP